MKRLLSIFLVIVLVVSAFPLSASAALDESELQEYLAELNWSEEELEDYLEFYFLSLEDFEAVQELRDFFGPVLTEENLQQLLDEYGLTIEELEDLLYEFGESLADYFFYEDLEYALFFYLDFEEIIWEDDDLLFGIFDEIGLTEEEFERLIDHLLALDYENPEFELRLMYLIDILETFEEFEDLDSAIDLSAEQIAELVAIFSELLYLFELEAKFFFIKDDEKNPVSFTQLMRMTTTNGYDLLIEFYNLQGEFLADIILTADLFGIDFITDTGSDLKEVVEREKEKEVKKEAQKNKTIKNETVKTEKGAKLPQTASNYLQNSLLGLLAVLAGGILFRKVRIRGI